MIWPMSASIVIPFFNAQNTLRPLVQALASVPELHSLELILVNDASRDNSWEVICQLAAQHDWIRGINLSRNYGQHNALLCGIRAATREVTITMDDDLQNPPEEIPRMLDLRAAFEKYSGPYVSIDVLLTWGTERFAAIPVVNSPRTIGVSSYTIRTLVVHALNMITGFSTLPLQFASFRRRNLLILFCIRQLSHPPHLLICNHSRPRVSAILDGHTSCRRAGVLIVVDPEI